MKKLLLLTLIGGLALSASAQYSYDRRDDGYVHGDNGRYSRGDNGRERQIAYINADFDSRINSVRHDPYLRRRDKRRQVRQLERERKIAVDRCNESYSGRFDNHRSNRNRAYRHEHWEN